LLLVLSRSLCRQQTGPVHLWTLRPLDRSPQVAPRGPNAALPRDVVPGRAPRSALGSAVLAA
jgi:hypothetical protein